MSDQSDRDEARRRQLDEVIGDFLVALDSGGNPDPREWLIRHPDLGPELADFFADRARVDDLIEPMRAVLEPEPPRTASEETLGLEDAAGLEGVTASVTEANVMLMSGLTAPKLGECPQTDGPKFSGFGAAKALDDGRSEQLTKGARVRYLGDYELERVLGEGGMGIVYKARQLSLNRPVALKMIKSARFASTDDLRRFHNVAEAVARLDHPNIVPIFEVGQFEDQHYFSMKLIAGESLDKRLKDYLVEPRRAARLLALMSLAIHHAHQRGILHRDLKPANVLVDSEGQPYMTDFGLAKRVEGDSELTQSGTVLGTPAYMAPEQTSAKKGAITTSTDVYGLGAILYALLTGRGPFGGTTVLETLDQVRQRLPEAPRSLNPRAPRDLEVICLKCLEKDPRRRYASADALAEDLKRWLACEPIAARPVGPLERVWSWCHRHPELALTDAALVFSLIVGTVISLVLAGIASHRAHEAESASNRLAEEKLVSDQRLYGAQMNLELRAWQDGKMELLSRWLSDSTFPGRDSPDLRGFEWYYLDCMRHLDLLTLNDGSSADSRGNYSPEIAFSPNGSLLAWSPGWGTDESVRIWDLHANKEGRILHGDYSSIPDLGRGAGAISSSSVFSPDGLLLAMGSSAGAVWVWEVKTGRLVFTLLGHSAPVTCVRFSPDGRRIASVGRNDVGIRGKTYGELKMWDATTGMEQWTMQAGENRDRITSFAFSPDGRLIATVGHLDSAARIWDSATGQPTESQPAQGYAGWRTQVAFSPDGSRIVLGGVQPQVLETRTGREVLALRGDTGQSVAVAYCPDGRRLSTSTGTIIHIWDSSTGEELLTLRGHHQSISGLAFSPDGRRLASISVSGVVKVWDAIATREHHSLFGHPEAPYCVAFSSDGTRVAAGGGGSTRVWEVASGREIALLNEDPKAYVLGIAFSPDGSSVATYAWGGVMKIRDAITGRTRVTFSGSGDPSKRGRIALEHHSIVYSSDGRIVAAGFADGVVRVLDATSGQVRFRLQPRPEEDLHRNRQEHGGSLQAEVEEWQAQIKAITIRPDGQRLAVAIANFRSRNRYVVPSSRIWIWDLRTGQRIAVRFSSGAPILDVAFSPDGGRIATAHDDGTARVWDASNGSELLTLYGHTTRINRVEFTKDGRRILTAGHKEMILWNPTTGQQLLTLSGKSVGKDMAISPDGLKIASVGGFPWVTIYDARIPSAELRIDLDALSLIRSMDAMRLSEDEITGRIRRDALISDTVRQRALELVAQPTTDVEANELNNQSWGIVRRPDATPEEYRTALRLAESVCRFEPDHGLLLNTLGVAQYRSGRYHAALETLTRSNRLNGGRYPSDIAFLAMAQYRLGQAEAARSTLSQLRELRKSLRVMSDDDQSFLRDAERLILEQPVNLPDDVFAH